MSWILRYSKRAKKDAELLRRSGLASQARKILEVLIANPFQNPPPYEKLSGEFKGKYSRRLNIQHRVIYEALKDEMIVNVLQMWTHYE